LIHSDFRCEFYLIRHGESSSNATPGFAADTNFDSPLTEKGYEQARLLGGRLKREEVRFDRVYSSTLVRAVQTTETMLEGMDLPGMPFVKVDALIEQRMPGWRGVPVEEVYTPEMLAYIRRKGLDFVPPEGDSHRMVQRRVATWLEDEIIYNKDLSGTETSLTVAIVGHGAATRCLIHYIMGFSDRFIERISLGNCSISRFLFDSEGWALHCLNDTCHIDGSGA